MIVHMPHAKKSAVWLICAGVFLASIIVQSHFWQGFGFVDGGMWSSTATAFAHGRAWNASAATVTDTALIYPATTILIPASALIASGFPADLALQLAVAALLSVISAAVAALAYLARPESWWWLALSALLLSDRLYQSATLASAVMIPFAILFVLLCSMTIERPSQRWSVMSLGIVIGLMLATRLDISLALGASAALLLLRGRRFRDIATLVSIAAVTFAISGPFWILPPVAYVSLYVSMMRFAPTLHSVVRWSSFFNSSAPYMPLSGLLFGLLAIIYPNSMRRPLAPSFFWWLLLTTGAISGAMLLSQGWQTRYFYPLYAIWDALFLLYVLEFIRTSSFPRRLEFLREFVLPILFCVFVVAAQMPDSLLYTFLQSLLHLH